VERLAQNDDLDDDRRDEPYRILPHGRYAHREDYVRQVLQNAGFAQVDIKPVVLRRERGEDVHGHLVAALMRVLP
jgi:predicted TPR repeat methyltransferase